MSSGIEDSEHFRKARRMFNQAMRLPASERENFVLREAGGDQALAARVTLLMQPSTESASGAREPAKEDRREPPAGRDISPDAAKPAVAPGADESTAHVGSLSDFEMLEQVGSGGMGDVWRARQISLNRPVAIKMFRARSNTTAKHRENFIRESQIAARLQHPHIIPIYTAGSDGDRLYYVMEFVEGVTLGTVLRALGAFVWDGDVALLEQLPAGLREGMNIHDAAPGATSTGSQPVRRERFDLQRRALTFLVYSMLPVILAIEYAHVQGVVHGDIKPDNLIFDTNGRLRILDFGLASVLSDLHETEPSGIAGTARYMSPEQVAGLPQGRNPKIDVYALGATLYECLTLKPIYEGATRQEILHRVATDNPKPIREINPRLHRSLEAIVERAISRRPRNRYATAQALATDLQRFLRHQPLSSAAQSSMLGRALSAVGSSAITGSLVALVGISAVAVGVQFGLEAFASYRADSERAQKIEAAGVILAELEGRVAASAGDGRIALTLDELKEIDQHLADARDLVVRAMAAYDAESDQRNRAFRRRVAAIRVRALLAAGRQEPARELLQEAEAAGLVDKEVFRQIGEQGLLRSRVELSSAALAECEVRLHAVSPVDKSTAEQPLATGRLPVFTSPPLFAGHYVAILRDASSREIALPLRVGLNEDVSVEIPILPKDVPAGMVYVGNHDQQGFIVGDEITRRSRDHAGPKEQHLSKSYFLDETEVTNAQYFEFFRSPDYVPTLLATIKAEFSSKLELEVDDDDWLRLRIPSGWVLGEPAPGTGNHPVHGVGWFQAEAYATWRDKRLPTEDEWERAARGIAGRQYPASDNFRIEDFASDYLTDVGSNPVDRSVYGVLDMASSVRELTRGNIGNGFAYRGGHVGFRSALSFRLAARSPRLANLPTTTGLLPIQWYLGGLGQSINTQVVGPTGLGMGFRCAQRAPDLHVVTREFGT